VKAYQDGYYAGLMGFDTNPHFLCSPSWWAWQWGNSVGHHVMCSQLEFMAYHYPQD
jgi:hypothetical protein